MSTATVQKSKSNQDTINLFEVGCLVNLRISMWSGRKMLTRADLVHVGYDPDKLPEDIVNLGRKLMVPKSELQTLNQIEQRARKALERWSVPFGIANAHFVPSTMIMTVEQQVKELKKEFFVRVDSFIRRFDDLIKAVKDAHPEFWDKCLKGHYPSNPKSLRQLFQFDWYTFKISGVSAIEEVSAEEVVAKQKVQNEREVELRQQMQTAVGEFVGEYVTTMRDETVRFCNLMTARINGTPFEDEEDVKGLTPKSISCFRNYIDRFRSMNVFGDGSIEKMLSEFRDTFLDSGVTPQDFESATVASSITKALEAIRNKAAAEGESGSQFIGELKRRIVI
ncbi:hypothetical protein LCGC14_0220950 [marine sediment metagenome]|uniref:DUF3150 domain-containing protein n=1 Tax=marine sediment metagenome TaxID=412755 RepID=A0A0F9UUP4_9ZZZZ